MAIQTEFWPNGITLFQYIDTLVRSESCEITCIIVQNYAGELGKEIGGSKATFSLEDKAERQGPRGHAQAAEGLSNREPHGYAQAVGEAKLRGGTGQKEEEGGV